MNIYPMDPAPESREEHNERMNAAMIKYQIARTSICPDCYLPVRLCTHLREPDLQCYFHKWPGE